MTFIFHQRILKGLQHLKHNVSEVAKNGVVGSVANQCKALDKCDQTCVKAVADGRKGGAPYGY